MANWKILVRNNFLWFNKIVQITAFRKGLLEKPTLAPTFQYKEISFKISLIGKSLVGKTSFINSLCSNKPYISSLLNENQNETHGYNETPGILLI